MEADFYNFSYIDWYGQADSGRRLCEAAVGARHIFCQREGCQLPSSNSGAGHFLYYSETEKQFECLEK